MRTLRLVLGHQISRPVSALRDLDRDQDVVLMAEVRKEATYVRHHRQEIVQDARASQARLEHQREQTE